VNRNLKKVAPLGVLTLALMSIAPAQAQQTELDALRTQIEELQRRLEEIESAQASQASSSTPNPLTTKEKVTMSGLLQVHGLGFLSEDIRPGGTRGNDTIRLRRGELRLTAPSITPRVSGTIMFDPVKAIAARNSTAAPAINIRARDNVLQEIQLSYLLNKNATNTTNAFIDIGQFKIPIGYEGDLVSSSALQTVERALFFTQRDPFDGGFGDVRDSGIQLRGTLGGQFDYRLGAFNGLGEQQNQQSSSDQKAIIGRLVYRPAGVQGLQLGISAANARSATPTSGGVRVDRDLLNGFVVYKKDKFSAQAEYLKGESQLQTAAAVNEIQGYYGSIGYLFTPKLEGVFRYDSLDTNRNVNNARLRDITLGLNYYIKGNNAKIQANIVQRESDAGVPAALRNDRTELRTNFQIAF
jgi:hypothetical protein